MGLTTINPTSTKAWKELQAIFENEKNKSILNFFNSEADRTGQFSVEEANLFLDFSKNRISSEAFKQLVALAEELNLKQGIDAYFSGSPINQTEGRAVLHTALRGADKNLEVNGENVHQLVESSLDKIKHFTEKIHHGNWKGYSGKPIQNIVNIGIGGSDLGPNMVVDALAYYKKPITTYFISNVDGDHIHETLHQLDPETTLFIVVSKSFSTQETLNNATTARKWLLQYTEQDQVEKHFVAVSANVEKAIEFGIDQAHIFPMWDWVGGRFSLWSAAGISIACAVGFSNFKELLNGANEMDQHFKSAKFNKNIPVILALLGVWYGNFYKAESEAIIPYSQYLQKLASYLQQASMESNGKSVGRNGNPVDYQTGAIVWGEPGTNSQHAFFQLMHQGTQLIPADFIGFLKPLHGDQHHQDLLMSNFFAQTEAFLKGKTANEVETELKSQGMSAEEIEKLLPFKIFEGNRPTNTLLAEKLTPKTLGSLIAMYEHKIFVQGFIWNVFSYDQWGVELGKQLANHILNDFSANKMQDHDPSTQQLINKYKKARS
ncbi:MAG: glucose-6-phosphate isomerase [Flavobacteriaceae bacterium]|nr:glucose-6-phosphate isomerase [Flavobacteriaceae bacterium]